MKKNILFIILLLILILIYYYNNKSVRNSNYNNEKRVIFISYIELGNYINKNDINTSKKNIDNMIKNIYDLKFNWIILQVRAFSDSIYESKIFPWANYLSGSEGVFPGFDVLEYFIDVASRYGIKIHAWINPYRVRNNSSVESISSKNPAYKYINSDYLYVGDVIYYNPAKEEIIDLIVDGVVEILDNYDVDGILFDDYFYPNNNISIGDYNTYLSNNNYISFDQYRLNVVSKLVKKVHKVCHDRNKLFGISPSGNIDNNYKMLFADVKKWGSSSLYVDYLMPQIYYGFYNEVSDFNTVVHEWENIVISNSVKLIPALAFYKVGNVDMYAKSGSNEWIDNDDIIMREVIMCRNLNNYYGFALYRYDYLFKEELKTKTTMNEVKNLKEIIK